jgi:low affinity Fe/Cu permease
MSHPRRSPSPFDRLAETATQLTSRGIFFAACLLLVILWVPSYVVVRNVDTWQLIINTATTIVTFLLVALLQSSARRSERAIHHKLDALADGLADLMDYQVNGDVIDLKRDIDDLKRAVGLERLPRKPRQQRRRERDPARRGGREDGEVRADLGG